MVELAVRLKQLRMRSGKSLQEVADAVGASKAHIWDLERGASKNPSLILLKGLADYYKIGIAELVGEDPDAGTDEPELVALYRNLSELDPEDRETIAMIAERLKASRKP
ncbi:MULTISPECIES: helix-turn-helix transcriptional regulator [Mesorhizobium]|uniref:helix-turn-helix domain-containing protein n=1 Tax=Mesorhizobium TaxID=68287 RepID=UPI000801C8DE|nr:MULTISPECIES: helix-turn-helix transcriptional regulator [Mesorhizobium]MUT27303.1 helix-turn-helix domain-containing protein [Mesorhizobium japonicum]OBQ83764.1 transcriptional regulator [Mesorhizobium sp. WSM3873]